MANEQPPTGNPGNGPDLVATLIRSAGRRPAPPADAYERTLAVATAALERKLGGRRQRRWRIFALAASLLSAVGLALVAGAWLRSGDSVASAVHVVGQAHWAPAAGSSWRMLTTTSRPLTAGSRLKTAAGGKASLWMADGVSLRLAPGTEIALVGPSHIDLVHGRVYVDSARGGSLEVATAVAVAHDVGTQFEVTYVGTSYRLRTREGQVVLRRGSLEASTAAGDELSFVGAGPLQHSRVAADDPQWQWVEELAPVPQIDGRPVRVLLAWVARETGRVVRYANPATEQKAARTTLHGSIRGLAPLDALAVVLATTDLGYELLPDRTILITARAASDGLP